MVGTCGKVAEAASRNLRYWASHWARWDHLGHAPFFEVRWSCATTVHHQVTKHITTLVRCKWLRSQVTLHMTVPGELETLWAYYYSSQNFCMDKKVPAAFGASDLAAHTI